MSLDQHFNFTSVNDLVENWRASGLKVGDTVLVHSTLRRLLLRFVRSKVTITPQAIFESFREAVGPTGTLVFPLFNFGFAKGEPFDIRTTPSQMGILSEVARLHSEAVRTGHPFYSFAVIGDKSEQFRGLANYSG